MYGQPPGYPSYTPNNPASLDGSYNSQYASHHETPRQQACSPGYTPVSFDAPTSYGGGVQPERFYGQLIDPASGRPSEVLARMADSLFFLMDTHCDVVGLQNTGHIEPRKYAWLMRKLGDPPESVEACEMTLEDFYTSAQVPFRLVNVQGQTQPVIDRRGFLHVVTFELRAAPDDAYSSWSKALAAFSLVDPATQQPLPTPLPRSAFPVLPDTALSSVYIGYQMRAIAVSSRARTTAMIAQMTGAAGLGAGAGANPYMSMYSGMFSGGAGGLGGGTNPYLAAMQTGQGQAGANPYMAAIQASQAQSAAMSNQMLQNMQAQQQKQSYVGTAANLITTLMGGGGFTGLGI